MLFLIITFSKKTCLWILNVTIWLWSLMKNVQNHFSRDCKILNNLGFVKCVRFFCPLSLSRFSLFVNHKQYGFWSYYPKDRWSVFLRQWERALGEDREVIVLGDMNINHLEWSRDDLPPTNQTHKLKPLIQELFTRILPHYKTNMSVYIPVADNRPLRSAIVSHYGNMGIILYPIELKTTNHFIRSHKTILR